jgi:hypothetical protein
MRSPRQSFMVKPSTVFCTSNALIPGFFAVQMIKTSHKFREQMELITRNGGNQAAIIRQLRKHSRAGTLQDAFRFINQAF